MAGVTNLLTIVRSMTHRDFEHGSAAYAALTGHAHPLPGTNTPVRPEDFPTYGALVSRLGQNPQTPGFPDSIILGPVMHQGNRPPIPGTERRVPGPDLRTLSDRRRSRCGNFRVSSLNSPAELPTDRLRQRHKLLQSFDRDSQRVEPVRQVTGIDSLYQRAFGLLGSARTRAAFRMDTKPDSSATSTAAIASARHCCSRGGWSRSGFH
ncbi:MAG: hypothetical protein CM1200mP2_31890 [Planctomycetaceae bacterium]|nr:MAG: hypothetical protein CM1200mP2_31890 [Planctomycetaceae bacterium]